MKRKEKTREEIRLSQLMYKRNSNIEKLNQNITPALTIKGKMILSQAQKNGCKVTDVEEAISIINAVGLRFLRERNDYNNAKRLYHIMFSWFGERLQSRYEI